MTRRDLTLVGDGIENPWNAQTLVDAAGMFGSRCLFRDRGKLARAWTQASPEGAPPPFEFVEAEAVASGYAPIVALDNVDGAGSLYGFRLPGGARPAMVVGNERRGISRDLLAPASHAVQIPLASRTLDALNVAAAAAVGLYYLTRGGGAPLHVRPDAEPRRPEVLLMGAADHVELGSAIRSAGALGWTRLFLEDREGLWFGRDRARQAEGRAAARRRRNPIRLIPAAAADRYAFQEVCVVTATGAGAADTPLPRAGLARGPQQAIAIPDESRIDVEREAWERLGRRVHFVRLDVPGLTCRQFVYHYRLMATIALAEAARQVGRRSRPAAGRPSRPAPIYDAALRPRLEAAGEIVYLEDLQVY